MGPFCVPGSSVAFLCFIDVSEYVELSELGKQTKGAIKGHKGRQKWEGEATGSDSENKPRDRIQEMQTALILFLITLA